MADDNFDIDDPELDLFTITQGGEDEIPDALLVRDDIDPEHVRTLTRAMALTVDKVMARMKDIDHYEVLVALAHFYAALSETLLHRECSDLLEFEVNRAEFQAMLHKVAEGVGEVQPTLEQLTATVVEGKVM